MNQLDESVVTPSAAATDSPTSSVDDPTTANPAISAPEQAQPMPDPLAPADVSDVNSPASNAQVATDATQPLNAPLETPQVDAPQTSLPTPTATPNMSSVDPLSGSIKTVPMPTEGNTDLASKSPEESPDEVKPVDISQPLETVSAPTMDSPISSPTPSVPQLHSEPVTQSAPADEAVPSLAEIPGDKPLSVSPDTSNSPKEAETTAGEPAGMTPPSVDAVNDLPTTPSPIDPVVIDTKPQDTPEPLPTPLTPPTIKTSPSPVIETTPPANQVAAPVNVAMSSPTSEVAQNTSAQSTPALVKGAGKYQVRVINEKCIGAASCVAVAPKAFKLNEQQIAEVLASASEESDENLLLSAQSCPTMAIEIIDSETGKKVWPR
jgi:ferredoxin